MVKLIDANNVERAGHRCVPAHPYNVINRPRIAFPRWQMMEFPSDGRAQGLRHRSFPCPRRSDKDPRANCRTRSERGENLPGLIQTDKLGNLHGPILLCERLWE